MTAEARGQLTIKWLDYALSDLAAATRQYNDRAFYQPYHTCFWAQQAAEKAIKAALIFENIPFDPTHNLDNLAASLPDSWQVRRTAGMLGALTNYGVETRYPQPTREPTRQDAEKAVGQARAIYAAVCRDVERRGFVLPAKHRQPPQAQQQVSHERDRERGAER